MPQPIDTTSTRSAGQNRLGWRQFAIWVVATIVGGPIVYLLPQQALALVDGESWLLVAIWSVAGLVFGALAGTIVGLLQRLALRGSVQWADKWVSGTVIGWAIGGAILMALTNVSYTASIDNSNNILTMWIGTMAWFALGVGIGLGQWLVLRQHLRRAGWWVVATALGWGLSVVVILIAIQNATQLIEAGGMIGVAAVLLIVGPGVSSIPGIVTGLILNVLISQNNLSTNRYYP